MVICVGCFSLHHVVRQRKYGEILPASAACIVGYLPAIVYNIQHPGASLYRAAGRLFGLDRSFLTQSDKVGVLVQKIAAKISAIPHFTAVLCENYLHYFGAMWGTLFFVSFAVLLLQRKAGAFFYAMYAAVFCLLSVVAVQEHAIRYVTPLYVIAPFVVGHVLMQINRCAWGTIMLTVVCATWFLSFGGFCVTHRAMAADRGFFVLVRALEAEGVRTAYAEYTAANAVSYLSGERIMASEVMHSSVGVRYRPYADAAAASTRKTYVYDVGQKALVDLKTRLGEHQTLYRERIVGQYAMVMYGS
jgi:hypothetical protein